MIAVLFEAQVTAAQQERYLTLAAELKPRLETIDGFIAIERFESLGAPGKILSLSWWRDEQAVAAWKRDICHLAAQREGRESIFANYQIRVAQVLREYSMSCPHTA